MSVPCDWIEALRWAQDREAKKTEVFLKNFQAWKLKNDGVPPIRPDYRQASHEGQLDGNPESVQREIRRVLAGGKPRQSEKWIARAFFNHYRQPSERVEIRGEVLEVLDYETPLQAPKSKSNGGIGRVDLVARGPGQRPALVELKTRRAEKVLKAIIELGVYGQILSTQEAKNVFCASFKCDAAKPYDLIVLGSEGFFNRRAPSLREAARELGICLGASVRFVEIRGLAAKDVQAATWLDRRALSLDPKPRFKPGLRLELRSLPA